MTVRILVGHVLDQLAALPAESVHCVVTSPPYYGLRDYGIEPQVWGGDPGCGHEFATETVTGEIRTGLGLAALGERYRGGGHKQGAVPTISAERGLCACGAWLGSLGLEPTYQLYVAHMVEVSRAVRRVLRTDGTFWLNLGDSYAGASAIGWRAGNPAKNHGNSNRDGIGAVAGLKPKDLAGIPWRVAFALQDDGWWLRSDIVWHKPNPMPESVTDRPTKAHEYLFLLTKAERYFYDAAAIAESSITGDPRQPYTSEGAWQLDGRPIEQRRGASKRKTKVPGGWDAAAGAHGTIHRTGRTEALYVDADPFTTRNRRSVWTVATAPYAEAHFATFPPALIEPCILAGCPKGGTVLDPFGGAGTTGLVASQHGRDAILVELNPQYAAMARNRIKSDMGDVEANAELPQAPPGPLFGSAA